MNRFWMTLSAAAMVAVAAPPGARQVQSCDVPASGRAHDLAVAPDGDVAGAESGTATEA